VLEDEGHTVLMAQDGRDALDQLRSGSAPCAILLDLVMPRMTGWELVAALRRDPTLADIPFAIMGANPRYASEAKALGARRWLAKPMELDDVVGIIDELCQSNPA
jgi:chemosensory pili system protein ChpA (sensor histidine kinase/response regulator)